MGTRVAVLADYWRPGWRAGGPIVSLARLVDKSQCETVILTRDHDLGDSSRYFGISPNTWEHASGSPSKIAYLAGWSGLRWATRQLRGERPDMIHVNSLHSPLFGVLPLLALRLGVVRSNVVLITPHGELAPSALRHKWWKKTLARPFLRWLVPTRAIWHASSQHEASDVINWLKRTPNLVVAPDPAPDPAPSASTGPKAPTVLFASRIHPIKGLDVAIRIMGSVQTPCRFVIAGQPEDDEYWANCQKQLAELPRHIGVDVRGPYSPDESSELMDQATVLLLPTKGENFGQVIAEALSRGCPVAIPPTTPWPDYVGTDLGCVDSDPDSLARFVTELLTEPIHRREFRRARTLDAYRAWFATSEASDLYVDVFELAGALP